MERDLEGRASPATRREAARGRGRIPVHFKRVAFAYGVPADGLGRTVRLEVVTAP
jgi:hypothetical protein